MTQTAPSYFNQTETFDNPIGTDGFECVEFASSDSAQLQKLFDKLGFTPVARHKSQNIVLYRQGDLNFLINGEPGSFASQFQTEHGPCACAMGFRVKDAKMAYQQLIDRGAEPYTKGGTAFDVPAIYGIGGSIIYLMDDYADHKVYAQDFEPLCIQSTGGVGLTYLDHLTHNVHQGNMDQWAEFYIKLFNFREIRYFDIKGERTGLISRAMSSPCGKIRIPINEGTEYESQIEEYLREYHGEGIQHIAFGTDNIYETVEALRSAGIGFLEVPDTYFELLESRMPGHNEDLERLRANKILMDGEMDKPGKPLLLQIFTNTVIGPIFFEIIQRKGHQGFGEGNFQALFDAMELDQVRRGVL
jgi:4-hydroxyphenylpyruvate dioxygenase